MFASSSSVSSQFSKFPDAYFLPATGIFNVSIVIFLKFGIVYLFENTLLIACT